MKGSTKAILRLSVQPEINARAVFSIQGLSLNTWRQRMKIPSIDFVPINSANSVTGPFRYNKAGGRKAQGKSIPNLW